MAQVIALSAETRSASGKGGARQTRREHKVPAVIYGHGRPAQPLTVDALALEKALTGVDPESTVIELTLDGKKAKVLIREIQRHAIRPDIIHVDFYEIRGGEKVRLKIPVHLVGTPDGVRNAGGVLDQVMREVEVEVLPEHIPARVELDVTPLAIGHSRHVRDLQIPNATILSGADLTSLRADPTFDPSRDLLILVDDFNIPAGTFRLRADGSAGGHNGLKSIEGALQSQQYARLRIGVGPLPEGVSDWAD